MISLAAIHDSAVCGCEMCAWAREREKQMTTQYPVGEEAREPETYPMPKDGWTCFHCGERFTSWGSAQDHFGATQEPKAGCLINRVALEDGTNTQRGRGLLVELRKIEASRDEWMQQALSGRSEIETLECRVESLTKAMQSYKPFRECRSINDVFFVFDSMEGRAIAAESIRAELERERDALKQQLHATAAMLKETAFALHVEEDHKPAFANCANVLCSQACYAWNKLTEKAALGGDK